jgi:hypothetical protein
VTLSKGSLEKISAWMPNMDTFTLALPTLELA